MLYINKNKLEHIIKLETHTQVVNTILKQVNLKLFDVVRDDTLGYTAITPKGTGIRPTLCVHTDTVGNVHPEVILKTNDVWRNANMTKLLGADDRAGCYIVKELLTRNDNTYNYCIFDLEEVGGIGSSNFARTDDGVHIDSLTSAYIGLDRLGCMQQALYGYESDEFLKAIECNYWVNECGSFTDASNLAGDFGKCCMNLSVGYDNEHTRFETLNLTYLSVTLNRLWNGLNDALYGTYFIADEIEYNYYDDYYDKEFYDEYVYCNESASYIPFTHKWMYEEFNGDFELPTVIDKECENSESDFLMKGM